MTPRRAAALRLSPQSSCSTDDSRRVRSAPCAVPAASDSIVSGVVPRRVPSTVTAAPGGRESTTSPLAAGAGAGRAGGGRAAVTDTIATSTDRDGRSAVNVIRRSALTYPGRETTIVRVPSSRSRSASGDVPRGVPSTVTLAPAGVVRTRRRAVSFRAAGAAIAPHGSPERAPRGAIAARAPQPPELAYRSLPWLPALEPWPTQPQRRYLRHGTPSLVARSRAGSRPRRR